MGFIDALLDELQNCSTGLKAAVTNWLAGAPPRRGPVNRDIIASQAIWNLFSRYELPIAVPESSTVGMRLCMLPVFVLAVRFRRPTPLLDLSLTKLNRSLTAVARSQLNHAD